MRPLAPKTGPAAAELIDARDRPLCCTELIETRGFLPCCASLASFAAGPTTVLVNAMIGSAPGRLTAEVLPIRYASVRDTSTEDSTASIASTSASSVSATQISGSAAPPDSKSILCRCMLSSSALCWAISPSVASTSSEAQLASWMACKPKLDLWTRNHRKRCGCALQGAPAIQRQERGSLTDVSCTRSNHESAWSSSDCLVKS